MRILNRLLTLVISVALIAFGVLLAVEVVGAMVGTQPLLVDWTRAYRAGRGHSWNSNAVRIVASAVTAGGLLLLLAQLKPRRISRLGVRTDDQNTDAAVTRAGVQGALKRAAESVDGISAANVKLGRRRAKVVAHTRAGDAALHRKLTTELQAALADRLSALLLTRPPRVRVRVQARKALS